MSGPSRSACSFALALIAGLSGIPAVAAERWTPDQNKCNTEPTTVAIVECLDARTKVWDARLNQAYRALTTMLQDPELKNRIAPLKAAQRAWLQYRDANCGGYYESQQGTIRQVVVASCMLTMTQDRAIELQGEGPQ